MKNFGFGDYETFEISNIDAVRDYAVFENGNMQGILFMSPKGRITVVNYISGKTGLDSSLNYSIDFVLELAKPNSPLNIDETPVRGYQRDFYQSVEICPKSQIIVAAAYDGCHYYHKNFTLMEFNEDKTEVEVKKIEMADKDSKRDDNIQALGIPFYDSQGNAIILGVTYYGGKLHSYYYDGENMGRIEQTDSDFLKCESHNFVYCKDPYEGSLNEAWIIDHNGYAKRVRFNNVFK